MKKLILITTFLLLFFINVTHAQWINTGGPSVMSTKGVLWFANKLYVPTTAGIFISTDQGANWTNSSTGLPGGAGNDESLISFNNLLFVACYGYGIYYSVDSGQTWYPRGSGAESYIRAIRSNGTNLYCAGISTGAYLSTNSGANWILRNNGIPSTSFPITSFAFHNNIIFAGTNSGGVYATTNNGLNWVSVSNNMPITNIYFLRNVNGTIFCGTIFPVPLYKTINDGTNWIPCNAGLGNDNIYSMHLISNTLLLGGYGNVYVSTNTGQSWTNQRSGLPNGDNIIAINNDNTNIYVATGYSGIWKRPITDLVGIQNISSEIPEKYSLSQNYPNPFNPSTKIQYGISRNGFVRLIVFDILGKEIATLVNTIQQAGTYETTFNASQYPSGVYFYRLTTNGFTETKKMLLIK